MRHADQLEDGAQRRRLDLDGGQLVIPMSTSTAFEDNLQRVTKTIADQETQQRARQTAERMMATPVTLEMMCTELGPALSAHMVELLRKFADQIKPHIDRLEGKRCSAAVLQ